MSIQKVIHGDALEELRRLSADKDIVIVTDPPYNIGYHYRTYSDKKNPEDFWNYLCDCFSLAPCAAIMYPEDLYRLAKRLDKIPDKVCSWVYNANTAKQHRDIAYFGIIPDFNLYKQPYKDMKDKRIQELYRRTGGARSYDWLQVPQVKNKNKDDGGVGVEHPCQMPVEVMKWIVGVIPGDATVVDPFCGSGTTGVACKLLNRNFIGIEMDEDYVKLAQARIDRA